MKSADSLHHQHTNRQSRRKYGFLSAKYDFRPGGIPQDKENTTKHMFCSQENALIFIASLSLSHTHPLSIYLSLYLHSTISLVRSFSLYRSLLFSRVFTSVILFDTVQCLFISQFVFTGFSFVLHTSYFSLIRALSLCPSRSLSFFLSFSVASYLTLICLANTMTVTERRTIGFNI